MLDKLKKLFGWSTESPPVVETKKSKSKKPRTPNKSNKSLTAKELATLAGEPYVAILSVDVDPSNINAGSFELDWNDKFVVNLVKSGYKTKPDDTDQIIVDRWFQTVCRNIALEVYEQKIADPVNRDMEDVRRIHRKDIGDGRSEVS